MQEIFKANVGMMPPDRDRIQEIITKLDIIMAMLGNLYSKVSPPQTMSEEERVALLEKARSQYEKLKREADLELESDLKKRELRGVDNRGDAVEPEDLKILDADYTK